MVRQKACIQLISESKSIPEIQQRQWLECRQMSTWIFGTEIKEIAYGKNIIKHYCLLHSGVHAVFLLPSVCIHSRQ